MTEKQQKSNGFIKLHRDILNWEWYGEHKVFVVFLHCLLKANHKDKKWQGIEIKRGSFISSYSKIGEEIGLGVQSVRTSINKLELTGELTRYSTSRNTLLTVNNYEKYQGANTVANKQLTINQQTTNKQLTTTKNVKNVKNTVPDAKPSETMFVLEGVEFKPLNKDFAQHALAFKRMVQKVRVVPDNANLDDWATELRLCCREKGRDNYLKVLKWYEKHIGEKYISECFSGSSFRKKFTDLVNAILREEQQNG